MEKTLPKRIEDLDLFRECPRKYWLRISNGLTKHTREAYYSYCREQLFIAAVQWASSRRGGERKMVMSLASFLKRTREHLVMATPSTVDAPMSYIRGVLVHDCKQFRYLIPKMIPSNGNIIFSNARYEIEGIRGRIMAAWIINQKLFVCRLTSHSTPLRNDPSIQWDGVFAHEETGLEPNLIWIVCEEMGRTKIKRVPYWGIDEAKKEAKTISSCIDNGVDYRCPSIKCNSCTYRTQCYGGIDAKEGQIYNT